LASVVLHRTKTAGVDVLPHPGDDASTVVGASTACWREHGSGEHELIRKLDSGKYRLYSRQPDPKTGRRRNLGTFKSRTAAEKHERAVQFFKRRG
jgi:hypothetical protein